MAQELDNLEFWLPSGFLTDDGLLTDFKSDRLKTRRNEDFSDEFRNTFGVSSEVSSPMTDTESDGDDRISELTWKLAQSTLQNANLSSQYTTEGWKLSGSPQQTFCGCKPGSRGSPNSHPSVCLPQGAEDQRRWDLLYAAAGEVARMRIAEETTAFYSSKFYSPFSKHSAVTTPRLSPNRTSPFYPSHQAQTTPCQLSYQLFEAPKIKQHQMMKNGSYGQGSTKFQLHSRRNDGGARSQGLSMSTWPNFQQPGSVMRDVFLGETGVKIERTGTGVFLPQRFGSAPAETDAELNQRNSFTVAQQRRRPIMLNQQCILPPEWTY